jgi:molybdenum cofactor synthesis domain-containing protein
MNETPQFPRAACLLIGDELLSGRTRDSNAHHLAGILNERGVPLIEIRTVPDEIPVIVRALGALRQEADIVFTSGGIGPTHDDITADAVAEALGRPISEREDALKILEDHYGKRGETVTDSRRRMARIPDGAELIANPISAAPGFTADGVYVLAGVPAIFEAMLASITDALPQGPRDTIYSVIGQAQESTIADGLRDLQTALKGLKIGSYPGPTGRGGDLIVQCRAQNPATAEQAARAVKALFTAQGIDSFIAEGQISQGDQ